ncbi:MAG TPA: bifunctional glutamate N-acetyltransferase/amino-acid acetyltransferase ArgJ [Acidimicrobiales bacterium]|nr:bifunctional glutamate N-acetyltransferase/amino-acid acetyltransferase ArgJ [Acidimicrobiales bacterium]
MTVTHAAGFVAASMACGIKPDGVPDLALVATDDGAPVPAAGVFTSNKATAAPVQVSRAHLAATAGHAAAVVLNSGNANAATGAAGEADAEHMCGLTAAELGCAAADVLVCSTGLIGIPLPMGPVVAGIPALVAGRGPGPQHGEAAARAIMTTDTRLKQTAATADDGSFGVGGMAKGAAMLAPNMATMLAVLTTDAAVDPARLQHALNAAVSESFNALSVDGCTSTNDTVIVLASGRAGQADTQRLGELLAWCCADLARQMAGDAEGATKVVTVRVQGARSDDEARRAARKVAESQLVKCSLYGSDPYWGRIVSELGSSQIAFDPVRVAVAYNGVTVCRDGVAAAGVEQAKLAAQMQEREIEVVADLGLGPGAATILTNDLSHAYIDENMRTS